MIKPDVEKPTIGWIVDRLMDAIQNQVSIVRELNALPLSRHVLGLFGSEASTLPPDMLVLVALVFWAKDGLPAIDPKWLDERLEALAYDAMIAPRAVYDTLADAAEVFDSNSLAEAAMMLLRHLADVYP